MLQFIFALVLLAIVFIVDDNCSNFSQKYCSQVFLVYSFWGMNYKIIDRLYGKLSLNLPFNTYLIPVPTGRISFARKSYRDVV